jgi:hypothetical protein
MDGEMRKVLFIILCFFIAFITTANAGELYSCTDRDGNIILTTNPQDGMKCELKNKFKKSTPELATEKEEVKAEKDNTTVKSTEALVAHINKCISCCSNKKQVCFNYLADSRICSAEETSCVATCNSEGASSSTWSECWSQSGQ